ncbi:uncharacterized protein P884DRAFT_299814 [Thermothelomyces heterothallicus CBS 202.75]|uniref:uncharacterized protein n=1 Tax=Thermothelomyces heterothallicus CBS 202.75 TaxID=1149848 RepID=UPI00374308C6
MQGPCSAVQVCSCPFDKLLYEHYHAPSFEPESLYRIASVSKVLGMHATLAVLKNRYILGPLSGYQTLLSLSPEHGIGYAAFAVDGRGRGGDGDFEKTLRRELERGTES